MTGARCGTNQACVDVIEDVETTNAQARLPAEEGLLDDEGGSESENSADEVTESSEAAALSPKLENLYDDCELDLDLEDSAESCLNG